MKFNSPEIQTLKSSLDGTIECAVKHEPTSYAAIRVQSLLNVTVYILACRFLEASVKHIVYNCMVMRGANQQSLDELSSRLKRFNNPEFANVKNLLLLELGFDVSRDINTGYQQRDITLLNELCLNRHRNVHANEDPRDWYGANRKNMDDFGREYTGLLNFVRYLDGLAFDAGSNSYVLRMAV
ncbi:hypothetical protein PSCICM_36840 [Pseudomonas cichorii]|uniref:hypothetical protein n=1 Tax=Pseudomonas cichorii TaxID=36746 RepID=UPI0019109095|nr:hypothetical protein [Pseudomonas cichorii]GFM77865.1 hypothetical protein PSCICM_36840 [Pseudomonas cichorii]